MNPANFLRDTIDLVKQIETRFLELGSRLYKIKTDELWSGAYDSFQEFLDTARINPGHASILVSIHKHYIVDGGVAQAKLAGVGYSNLYEAIPLIERDGIDKAVKVASTLTRAEIKQEVRDEEHPNCAHKETITICSSCHKRV